MVNRSRWKNLSSEQEDKKKVRGTPLRLQEAEEQVPQIEERVRRRINGKQPPPAYLKEMKLKRFEVEEDEAEVTRII